MCHDAERAGLTVRFLAGALLWLASVAPSFAQTFAAGERQLVVPFENASSSARLYWLAEASAVLLTDDLTALGAGRSRAKSA